MQEDDGDRAERTGQYIKSAPGSVPKSDPKQELSLPKTAIGPRKKQKALLAAGFRVSKILTCEVKPQQPRRARCGGYAKRFWISS